MTETMFGIVKWFDMRKGYGFIQAIEGEYKDKEIFCHQTSIQSKNFRTLFPGEYVSLEVNHDNDKLNCKNVTGINGGPLLTDNESVVIRIYPKHKPKKQEEADDMDADDVN